MLLECNIEQQLINLVDAALNKCLFSVALHAVCFKYSGTVNTSMSFLNSTVVECMLSVWQVPGSTPGQVYFLLAHSHLRQL